MTWVHVLIDVVAPNQFHEGMSDSHQVGPPRPGRRPGGSWRRWQVALALAVVAAGTWWVWMGWDTTYQVDPETGAASGPYAAWQVIGCALTLIVAGVLAARFLPVWILTPLVVIPFATSWAVSAHSSADSGLWVVGLALLIGGVTFATLVIGLLARLGWATAEAGTRGGPAAG